MSALLPGDARQFLEVYYGPYLVKTFTRTAENAGGREQIMKEMVARDLSFHVCAQNPKGSKVDASQIKVVTYDWKP